MNKFLAITHNALIFDIYFGENVRASDTGFFLSTICGARRNKCMPSPNMPHRRSTACKKETPSPKSRPTMSSSLPQPLNVHISTHPCVRAKLSQLRSKDCNARETKALIHEIALIVGCEALATGLQTIQSGTVSLLYFPPPDCISTPHIHCKLLDES